MEKTLLITLDFPPARGGVANYWANLSRFFDPEKYLVLAPANHEAAEFDLAEPYEIVRRQLLFKKFWPKWFLFFWQTLKLVKEEQVKNIIATQVLPGGTVCWLLKKAIKIEYLISFHGQDLIYAQRSFVKRWLLRKIISEAKQLIVNSQFTKSELLKFAPDVFDKVVVVYPCPNLTNTSIDLADQEILIDKLNLKDSKVLLSVCRLVERKGIDLVIQSVKRLVLKFPNLIYLIVGSGPFKESLDKIIQENNLSACVKIIENVSDAELPLYYSVSDVFVLPTKNLNNGDVEGFGIVYLEANLFGLPVVASDCGGVKEAVIDGETGLIIEENNLDALGQALEKLLNDSVLAQKMGTAGRARVLTDFSWGAEAVKIQANL